MRRKGAVVNVCVCAFTCVRSRARVYVCVSGVGLAAGVSGCGAASAGGRDTWRWPMQAQVHVGRFVGRGACTRRVAAVLSVLVIRPNEGRGQVPPGTWHAHTRRVCLQGDQRYACRRQAAPPLPAHANMPYLPSRMAARNKPPPRQSPLAKCLSTTQAFADAPSPPPPLPPPPGPPPLLPPFPLPATPAPCTPPCPAAPRAPP